MDLQLSRNFTLREFACRCGCTIPIAVFANMNKVCAELVILRDYLKKPIVITSAYRCLSHNTRVGGASRSYHMTGQAVDIVVKGMSPRQVFTQIKQLIDEGRIIAGGLKAYDTFVHYDIRGSLTLF